MAEITVSWLLARWRIDVNDPVQEVEDDQLWTDAEGIQYIDEAQKEFCSVVDCLSDPELHRNVPIAAGQETIYIEPVVTKIRRAILASTNRVLSVCTMKEVAERFVVSDYGFIRQGSWEIATGTPDCLVTDYAVDQCRIVPIPTVADALNLIVYRLPNDISSACNELEIPAKFRTGLLHKMKALCYDKQDADSYDSKASQLHEAHWQRWLSECARTTKVRARPGGVVSYGGY